MIEAIAAEAARTVVGSTLGYFIGKWFGARGKAERCRFLWKLEFEVSPRLLRDVLEREVREGCIKREEMDDRLWKIMQLRAKYGLGTGANVFGDLVQTKQGIKANVSAVVPPSSPPSAPKTNEDVLRKEFAQAKAMSEIGPPSFLKKLEKK